MAVFRVEKTKDYTVMSNHHLRDTNLSLKAKGMLSLMLSLPDDWDYTLAGLEYICKDGITSIRNTVTELEEHGYLSRRRLRNDKGQLGDIEYTIHEKPQACGEPVDNPMENSQPISEKPILENLTLDNPILVNPTVEKPILENHTQLNTNKLNTDKSNTKKRNTDVLNTYQSITGVGESFSQQSYENPIDEIDKFNKYRELIYKNIDYDCFDDRHDKKMLDEIVDTMLDYICGKRESVKIGGAEYPAQIVKSRLLKLDSSHIEYVIHCMKNNTTKIGNIRAYLLSALYNAPTTIDHYYTTLVNHDMANWQNNE